MERDNFVFYRSYWEQAKEMNSKDRLKFFEAICELALDGNEMELKGSPKIAFIGVKPQITANNKKYVNGIKGGVHGNKGGRPKKTNVGDTSKNPCGVNKETPNVNDNVNENDNDNVNDNVNVFGLFETEFARTISPIEIDMIKQWEREYDKCIIKLALKEAAKRGARNFRYIEVILNNWKTNGIRSEAEALEYIAKREKEIASKKGDKQLPEWFYEQDEIKGQEDTIGDEELAERLRKVRQGMKGAEV